MNYIILVSTALFLPTLFWFHTSHVDSLNKNLQNGESLTLWKKLISFWTAGMILVLFIDIWGLWYFGPKSPDRPELKLFDTSDYQAEIDEIRKSNSNITDKEVSEIMRIFRHAMKLISIDKYSEAEIVLQNLRNGSDVSGPFLKIISYSVDNNIGIVSFHIRRNKKFLASDYLLTASRVSHMNQAASKIINDNIDKLNDSVNELD